MQKFINRAKHAVVGAALSAPLVVLAQTDPWDAAFTAAETQFEALLPAAYVLMGVISVGLLVYGLARRFIRKG